MLRVRPRLLPSLILVGTLAVATRVAELWLSRDGESVSLVGPAAALAEEVSAAASAKESTGSAVPGTPFTPAPSSSAPTLSPSAKPPAPGESDYSPRIVARLAQLDQRARELDEREAFLTAMEQRLNQKFAELQRMRDEIVGLLQQHDQEHLAKIDSLANMYQSMKAKEAAAIFETLDFDVLVQVSQRMKEAKLADIMASLSPRRAQELSVALVRKKELPGADEATQTVKP